MAGDTKKVKARAFTTASELYGKQVTQGTDTFGRLGTPILHGKDKEGKPVNIEMTAANVGSFFEMFAYTIGAAIVSFNRKQIGYLRTLVLNADDQMLSDGRMLEIPITESKRFPLPGVSVSVKDALTLAGLVEKILADSAKVFPPAETVVAKSSKPDATEEIRVDLYS
jgi:hypothetical protein